MKTIKEIEKRMLEIEEELENEDADLEALETEIDELQEERKNLIEKAETRKAILAKVLNGGGTVIAERRENNGNGGSEEVEEERKILESAEYRSAFLKRLQGKKLNDAEKRAMTSATSSVGAVIPTITQDLVMEKLLEYAPLLNEIELMRVEGNVTFAVESTATDANIHTEGATITEDGDVLIPVTLTTYEITKYITISKTVAKMSVSAFEKWLTNMLAKRIARKITKLIINGTGTNQPKGIANANTWGATNSVTVAKASDLTEGNVTALTALLPGGYDKNAKWLMSKKTLLTDFRPLQDKSKNDIFTKENGKYYIEGYEVMLDEDVTFHEAYLGDFKMYVGNLAEDITVDTDKKLSANSFEYLGCAMFDGKPALGEAFVKLVKATS